MDNMELLSVTAAANRLGVSREIVRRRVKSGAMPSVRIETDGATPYYAIPALIVEAERARRERNPTAQERAKQTA